MVKVSHSGDSERFGPQEQLVTAMRPSITLISWMLIKNTKVFRSCLYRYCYKYWIASWSFSFSPKYRSSTLLVTKSSWPKRMVAWTFYSNYRSWKANQFPTDSTTIRSSKFFKSKRRKSLFLEILKSLNLKWRTGESWNSRHWT